MQGVAARLRAPAPARKAREHGGAATTGCGGHGLGCTIGSLQRAAHAGIWHRDPACSASAAACSLNTPPPWPGPRPHPAITKHQPNSGRPCPGSKPHELFFSLFSSSVGVRGGGGGRLGSGCRAAARWRVGRYGCGSACRPARPGMHARGAARGARHASFKPQTKAKQSCEASRSCRPWHGGPGTAHGGCCDSQG